MPSSIILRDKQAMIILLLKNTQQPWYLSSLAQASSSTYVHTCNFVKTCEAAGLIVSEKHGKIKAIKLTDKGMQIAELLSGIYTIMNQQAQAAVKQEEKKEEKK